VQTLAEIRALLEEHGLAPRKALGQNFLIDHNLIRKLVDVSGVGEGDLVLEVGPGTGTMTEELLHRGCEVVACELDAGLARFLRDRLGSLPGFTLVEGDCLESKRRLAPAVLGALAGRPFCLVSNLPYGSATPLILSLLVNHPECAGQYVTIQKEVADRLGARPGSKAYGAISVVAQLLADVRQIAALPRECFWPRPDVTSAMVAIEPGKPAPTIDAARIAAFCRRIFSQRRKQLGALLGDRVRWPEGVDRTTRAEALTPEQIALLCERVPSP
jgi:16S rRNA (adenine1518-N6/adenine1519-N6)-dimethyltransferase